MNILDQLAGHARERVAQAKREKPLDQLQDEALALPRDTDFPFERALKAEGMSFICECKKASPSKGLIAPEFSYLDIAKAYEKAGAAAISVLTEPKWFQGSDQYLNEIASTVSIPVLRKDFTVDPYMIYQAKLLGASALLLIVALMDQEELASGIKLCNKLGLSALVEAHDGEQLKMAIAAGARIIGCNNRDLRDFSVDIHNSMRLRALTPDNVIFVAESGIHTPEDVKELQDAGVDALLVGEQLMRAADPGAELRRLKGQTASQYRGRREP